jgi:flagellin-like hook-associated protein FlgL
VRIARHGLRRHRYFERHARRVRRQGDKAAAPRPLCRDHAGIFVAIGACDAVIGVRTAPGVVGGPGSRRGDLQDPARRTDFFDPVKYIPLNDAARQTLYTRATSLVGEAVAEIGSTQAEVGLAQSRVQNASNRVSSQIDLLKTFISDLERVDPFEASIRVTELLTQIETSYALTARIQQLSLIRYLP